MQMQKGDPQLAAFGRTAGPVTAEVADIVVGKNVPFAKTISSSPQLAFSFNPVGGSAGARENFWQTAGRELEVQLRGSGPIAAGPKGGRIVCDVSPMPGSPFAGNEPPHPGSAAVVSPAVQIASSVIGPISTGVSSPETAPAQRQATIRLAAESAPFSTRVQILHLQLEPGNLGKVAVKMRLSGPRLTLYVDAEKPETMRLICDDEKLLSERLHSAGYAIEELAIRTTDSLASHSGQRAAADASQEQHGGYTGGGPSSHDRPSMRDDNSPLLQSLDCDAQDIAANRPIDGDLYL